MSSTSAVRKDNQIEPHRVGADDLFIRLASKRNGLAQFEAEERLRHEGPNVLPEAARASFLSRLAKHLGHRFALLLWIGAALAFVGEHFSPGEGMSFIAWALVIVVVLNAAFGFWQESRVERAMSAFRNMLSRKARVEREGVEREIDAAEVVVGDVIVLREGDRVAADARLFEANALKVDNSPLTGECEPQLRTVEIASSSRIESRNLVFLGTLVTTGTGRALVYAIGASTEIGHIADVTHVTGRVETPISKELRHFVRIISIIALVLGVFFFAAGWIVGNPFWTNLIFAIGIIVANVPEGLLPTVTLALAIAGRKMAWRNALLKTLESAETLGSTTVICTDKTGTLTQNQMRVTGLYLAGEDQNTSESTDERVDPALRIMVLCNNATVDESGTEVKTAGDPTETALLLHVAEKRRHGVSERRNAAPRIFERPFDSATREMATAHRTENGFVMLLKGAPEVVLGQCTHLVKGDTREEIGDVLRAQIAANADRLALAGNRVLALAQKKLGDAADFDGEAFGSDYQFVGLVAMHDPPRAEVPAAVARCRAAGIRIIVVSGDHPLTVQAIAKEVGIVHQDAHVITGGELAHLGKAALRHALARKHVLFARTSPLDKLRIVSALQEMGQVVAVTGDGVNDAPALKRADIGVAMGQSGTDVAREAADMVLMDDNFATIVAAVEEGRVIYNNIRRFVGYVLTSNMPEILPYIAFVLLGLPLPLPVLLVLAVDLGTDMAPAIALATETAETQVMTQPPRPRSARLLSMDLLLSSYLLWGVLESIAGFATYFYVLHRSGWTWGVKLAMTDPLYGQATAAFFLAIVVCQVANLLVWRTTHQSIFKKGIFSNRSAVIGIGIELLLLVLIVQTPVGHWAFGTASVPFEVWLVPVPCALVMLVLAEVIKAGFRKSM